MIDPDQEIAFLGRGWSFPPSFTQDGGVKMVSGDEDVAESLRILLATRPGERTMQPDYGCDLDRLAFEPLDATLETYVQDLIATAILLHEPRVELEALNLTPSSEDSGMILITLDYRITQTNSRANLVFPFYRDEGEQEI